MKAAPPLQSAPTGQSLGRLTQRIADEIGEAIVTGAYPQGALLPVESELVARYGASRSVLREAIKVLNAKGLVTAKPRRGTTVTPVSAWNVFDPDVLRWMLARNFSLELLIQFTQIRIGIEPQAAALASLAASEADIARIGDSLARMQDAEGGKDDPLAADVGFHLAILEASHNLFFRRLQPLVETALHYSIRYTDSLAREENDKLETHRLVYEAIVRRDPASARRHTLDLLNAALALMERGLGGGSAQRPKG